ncbi:hypothetical protein C0991_010923 [Blastosporella zonata]|nr:hypothetical protein C0991_010923 [Blastosporella zonata]
MLRASPPRSPPPKKPKPKQTLIVSIPPLSRRPAYIIPSSSTSTAAASSGPPTASTGTPAAVDIKSEEETIIIPPPRPPVVLAYPNEPWRHPDELEYIRPHTCKSKLEEPKPDLIARFIAKWSTGPSDPEASAAGEKNDDEEMKTSEKMVKKVKKVKAKVEYIMDMEKAADEYLDPMDVDAPEFVETENAEQKRALHSGKNVNDVSRPSSSYASSSTSAHASASASAPIPPPIDATYGFGSVLPIVPDASGSTLPPEIAIDPGDTLHSDSSSSSPPERPAGTMIKSNSHRKAEAKIASKSEKKRGTTVLSEKGKGKEKGVAWDGVGKQNGIDVGKQKEMVERSPEDRLGGCTISWDARVSKALESASLVMTPAPETGDTVTAPVATVNEQRPAYYVPQTGTTWEHNHGLKGEQRERALQHDDTARTSQEAGSSTAKVADAVPAFTAPSGSSTLGSTFPRAASRPRPLPIFKVVQSDDEPATPAEAVSGPADMPASSPPPQSPPSVDGASTDAPSSAPPEIDPDAIDVDGSPVATRIVSIVQDTMSRLSDALSASRRDDRRRGKRRERSPRASGSGSRSVASHTEPLDMGMVMKELHSLKRHTEEQSAQHQRVVNRMHMEMDELRRKLQDLTRVRETDNVLEVIDVDNKSIVENVGVYSASAWGPSSASSPIDFTEDRRYESSRPSVSASGISRSSTAHPLAHLIGPDHPVVFRRDTPTVIKIRDSNSPALAFRPDDGVDEGGDENQNDEDHQMDQNDENDGNDQKEKDPTVCPPHLGVSIEAMIPGHDGVPLPIKSQRKGRMVFIPIDMTGDSS